MKTSWKWLAAVLVVVSLGCGNDADDERIGAECTSSGQCENEELTCLTQFKGGYCGASGCMADADCVEGSICVAQGGTNYCFRTCTDKEECNEHRSVENESNCSSNITRVGGGSEKACVPPSAG
jgi:hypothetical protein